MDCTLGESVGEGCIMSGLRDDEGLLESTPMDCLAAVWIRDT